MLCCLVEMELLSLTSVEVVLSCSGTLTLIWERWEEKCGIVASRVHLFQPQIFSSQIIRLPQGSLKSIHHTASSIVTPVVDNKKNKE